MSQNLGYENYLLQEISWRPITTALAHVAMRTSPQSELTVSETITTPTGSGKTVTGTLWLHPSKRGRFEVDYDGVRGTDGRTDYTDESHMRAIARMILREMAEALERVS
jgi:hypothetical protein